MRGGQAIALGLRAAGGSGQSPAPGSRGVFGGERSFAHRLVVGLVSADEVAVLELRAAAVEEEGEGEEGEDEDEDEEQNVLAVAWGDMDEEQQEAAAVSGSRAVPISLL